MGDPPPGASPRELGQASIEMVAALPVLLLAGLVSLQLLATGYALTVADGAAEAGALAIATGQPVEKAARAALPAWAEEAEIEVSGDRVTVRVLPPAALPAIAERLMVTSVASAVPAADEAGVDPASGVETGEER